MWYTWSWLHWKSMAIRRLQWTTFFTKHCLTIEQVKKWLLFNAWKKIINYSFNNKYLTTTTNTFNKSIKLNIITSSSNF